MRGYYSVIDITDTIILQAKLKVKKKAWTGPEGSRKLRFPDFKTIGTRRW